MGLGFGKKRAVLGKNRGAPPKTLEKVPFSSHSGRFSAFLVGHRGFYPKLHFFLPNPRPIAELQSYVSFFENSSVGPRSIYVSAVIWGKTGQKVGNGDKKGGKYFAPPKLLLPFIDLKFNVDYDSAIKHDLTL